MASTLPKFPIFEAIAAHDPNSTAVIHSLSGRRFRYGELLGDVCRAKDRFVGATGKSDLNGERVAFLVENSYDYIGPYADIASLVINCLYGIKYLQRPPIQ
jgi:malonyl-CoA/methylmalonyl-CoA synthetase